MTLAGILVFPGADELDVVGPFRVFTAAGIDTRLVAERAGPVTLGNGLVVEARHAFDDCPPLDVLLVAGGSSGSDTAGRRVEQRNERTVAFVRDATKQAGIIASVCTGAFLLAEAGVLSGRRANTHWMYRDELTSLMAERGEPFELVPERVVWDGDLVTAGGVTSGIDLALEIVERLFGLDRRRLVEAGLELETPA
jgi:transcriptional regulator GlxA family with amidase domain